MKDLDEIREFGGRRFLFKVERSLDAVDYNKYERLRMEIWGDPLDTIAGGRNLLCENYFDKGSSLFLAVFVEDDNGDFPEDYDSFAAFSYGFLGVRDKEIGFTKVENLQFYSQYTGVKAIYQKYGLGKAIKEFQKKVLLDLFRIDTVICTFDPLTGVNAHRNIHQFGMDILQYKKALYGEFVGFLNRADVPCDRFVASWNLKAESRKLKFDLRAMVEAGLCVVESEVKEIVGKSGPLRLEVVKKSNLDICEEIQLVEIPLDFYMMLNETDVGSESIREIPLQWRLTTREAFQSLFQRGYRIVDFCVLPETGRKRDFYVLQSPSRTS